MIQAFKFCNSGNGGPVINFGSSQGGRKIVTGIFEIRISFQTSLIHAFRGIEITLFAIGITQHVRHFNVVRIMLKDVDSKGDHRIRIRTLHLHV